MSGFEIVGLVLGVLGPLEQSINLTNYLRNHCKAFGENETAIQQLITFLNLLQHDLKQLQPQLQLCQLSIPHSNHKIIETQFLEMKDKIQHAQQSLTKMNQSADRNLKHFFKASKWYDKCKHILSQLQETKHSLHDINFFLGSNEISKQNIDNATRKIIQTVELHGASSVSTQATDKFQSHSQKLVISFAAVPDFESTDSKGNPSTIEGKLKPRLLGRNTHTKLFSVLGPGGVGKTTTIHMLTHNQQLREYFHDGTYYIKLGANAKIENVIDSFADIVRKSGGVSKGSEVQACESVDDAIEIVSTWFMNKRYLLLVDDVWEQNGLEPSSLSSLKGMISASDEGGMAFTTRDPCIATGALEAFRLDYREPQGLESRAILFQHARQNSKSKYELDTEKVIRILLETCGGLPVAHSVVGKGVLQFSMRRNVSEEDAWRMYSRRQNNVLRGKADEYPELSKVFEAAVCILQEESVDKRKRQLDERNINYKEIHRSLCVLEKQQWAPIDMLQCMWNIESEDETRTICENLVRVGLAEWYHEQVTDILGHDHDVECISIHDLVHDFATEEAKREDEVQTWHRRLVEGYANLKRVTTSPGAGCRQWWKVGEIVECKDGGYFIRNICRHLQHGASDDNEVVMLITRPEWINLQFCKNGVLQYESDVGYGLKSIQSRGENGGMGMKEIEMIRDASRLSASYIRRNSDEIWFQLYGRLMKWGKSSKSMKKYLKCLEQNAGRPWLQPIENSEGLLTSVGSGGRGIVDVGEVICSMIVLPGGEDVVCGCGNGELVVVSLKENVVMKRWMAHEKWITDLAISEKGKFVVSVSYDGLGKIWETERWDLMKTLAEHSERSAWIRCVVISRDGKRIFTGSRDWTRVFPGSNEDQHIRKWDVESGKCVQVLTTQVDEFNHLNDFSAMLVLRNGKDIITTRSEDDKLVIWEMENEYRRTDIMLRSNVTCLGVNKDESKIITGHIDGSLQLWDANNMTPINDAWTAREPFVTCVSFNEDGTRLVSGYDDGVVQVRDVNTGELVCPSFTGHTDGVVKVNVIEEDNSIVSCSRDKTVRMWKIAEAISKVAKEQIDEDVMCVTCSADKSCFVTGHWNGRLSVWDAATRKLIRESAEIHDGSISDVAVTPDGRWVVSVGFDRMVRVSNWGRLKAERTFGGHTAIVKAVQISKNQEFAVTRSYDRSIRIWDLIKCDGSHQIISSDNWGYDARCFISDDNRRIIVHVNRKDDEWFAEVWDIGTLQLVRETKYSAAIKPSREDLLSITGEPRDRGKKVFVRPYTNEIRYGDVSNSVVLGTTESRVRHYAYSSLHHVVAVALSTRTLRLIKLEL